MDRIQLKSHRRRRRKRGLRKRMLGTAARPRLTVFRSARHIYAQVIDDLTGRTLVAASTNEKGSGFDNGGNCDAAKKIGSTIAERAKANGVDKVVFDRNGYIYHGRVRSLADGAREGGLKF